MRDRDAVGERFVASLLRTWLAAAMASVPTLRRCSKRSEKDVRFFPTRSLTAFPEGKDRVGVPPTLRPR